MKYMGSKARIAKEVAPIINELVERHGIQLYIEPFVGGANMIQHIKAPTKYGCDNNPYLIAFWQQIQRGWNPLESVDMTRELYQDIKAHKDKYSPEIVALAGFCATYNAKWFGGYAGIVTTKIGTQRNYYDEAVRNVLKQQKHIQGIEFMCMDFAELDVSGALIYCDPPYCGATGYAESFDHERYWAWVRAMSAKNIVLCSEYAAPADFDCVWTKALTTTLDKNSRSTATEKLFAVKQSEWLRQCG